MIVTYNNEISIECVRALYMRKRDEGLYYVRLLDYGDKLIAAFDGVSFISKFKVTDGTLEEIQETSDDACHLAFMREDGRPAKGPAISTFLRGDIPFSHNILLTDIHFGAELPDEGVEGQLFFKLAE